MKLKLAAGDGPVYLTGTHSQETKEEADSESGMVLNYVLIFGIIWVLASTRALLTKHNHNLLIKS